MEQLKDEKNICAKNSFKGNVIDTIIMLIISGIVFLALDVIVLRLLGYRVIKEYIGTALFIIFALVSIVYPTFMECKKGATIGKRASNMKIKIVEDVENKESSMDETETKEIDSEVLDKEDNTTEENK